MWDIVTMKVTKKNTQLYVKEMLRTNKAWALRGLVRIFQENQTFEEQSHESTIVDNGIGFTGADGEFLSSIAKQVTTRKFVSDKQMAIVHKKMPKYWKQIIEMADGAKLNSQVVKFRNETQLSLKM